MYLLALSVPHSSESGMVIELVLLTVAVLGNTYCSLLNDVVISSMSKPGTVLGNHQRTSQILSYTD